MYIKNFVKLHPLSSTSKLCKKNGKGLCVYFDCLKNAFKNIRIKNIAIVGDFGVGKSSIIRSYEAKRHRFVKRKGKFLYISLGQYNHPLEGSRQAFNDNNPLSADKSEDYFETNTIERRLLLQIYSRFCQKDLPSSGYKMIPDKTKFHRTKSCIFAIMLLSSLLLLCKENVGKLFIEWSPKYSWIQFVREEIIFNRHLLQLILYCFILGTIFCFSYFLSYRLIPKLKLLKVSFKLNDTQFDVEKQNGLDYLDLNTMELIYCLEQIGKDIDRTIVFEDMDRLEPDVCIAIFTRLREINHMVNLRLPKQKYIRFIFVINNKIINQIDSAKFFDYSLSVVPTLNTKNAELIFMRNLQSVNQLLKREFLIESTIDRLGKKTIKQISGLILKIPLVDIGVLKSFTEMKNEIKVFEKDCFNLVEDSSNKGIVHIVAPSLIDYRKQFAVLNDYCLFVKLYYENNSKLIDSDIEKILAFVVYKHLWPNDYVQLNNGKSVAFSINAIDENDEIENRELLCLLKNSGKLSIRSLLYAGFCEEHIVTRFEEILNFGSKEDIINEIRNLQAEDIQCFNVLMNYCEKNKDIHNFRFVAILAETVRYILRCKAINSNEWFFSGRSIKTCIDALIILDEVECEQFIQKTEWTNDESVFCACNDWDIIPAFIQYWSDKRLQVFSKGIKRFERHFNLQVWDEEQCNMLRESNIQTELKKYR